MHKMRSAWRSPLTAALRLLSLLGLAALTACASPEAHYQALSVAVPESVALACARSKRPAPPPAGSLDAQLASGSTLSLAELERAYREVWRAYLARGAWIGTLSLFSLDQEGDVAACNATRAAAIAMLGDVNAADNAFARR